VPASLIDGRPPIDALLIEPNNSVTYQASVKRSVVSITMQFDDRKAGVQVA
jgi:hypothetical protein